MELNRLFLPALTAPGEVVTFYSYKGGTGRTMALSNIAVLLARRQNATVPILMVDWDMEAPGLHHYFDQHEEGPGVLEFFEACREQLALRRAAVTAADCSDAELARQVLAAIDWEQYVVRVDQGSPLYLMRAGRFDASYSERLALMHWDLLFDACPALFRCFADSLARHFRYVLVDSRTGRTDSAGICTTLLPRKLVVVFTPNRQSLEGVQALVTRATEYRRSHEDEQRPLLIYPLPSRIEMGDSEQRAQWRRGDSHKGILGFQPMFEQLLQDSYGLPQVLLDSYFDEVQLQQTKTFAYGEQLAARIDQGGDRFSLTRTFEAFLHWLTGGYFPWQSSREIHLLAAIAEARQAQEDGGGRSLVLPMARDLKRLGELYRKEGKAQAALDCFQQSLEIRVRVLGEEHIDTLVGKSHLASMLRQMHRLAEAQFLEECVAATRLRLLGADHPDTLSSQASLAATLALQGDYLAALQLHDVVLQAYRRLFGPEHLLTLGALASRAATLVQMGELDEARALQESVVAARERLLGTEHPDTLHSKNSLAQTLVLKNELGGARQLLEAVIEAHQRRLGADHALTLEARERLSEVLARLGDLASLRALHEGLVAARARTLGLDHPHTLTSQRKLAAVLVQYGELDEARGMLERILQAHERVLGEDHLDTLHSKSQLAGALWQQGKQDAARVLEDAILSASERLLSAHGAAQPDALSAPEGVEGVEGVEGAGANGGGAGLVAGTARDAAAPPPAGRAAQPQPQAAAHLDGQAHGALSGARGLKEAILAARARARETGLRPDPNQPGALADMVNTLQTLIDGEHYRQARTLAEALREPLLKPGVAPKLRKRGMTVLKKMYRVQGDKDALVALQEDEVSALEGALSEARLQPLSDS